MHYLSAALNAASSIAAAIYGRPCGDYAIFPYYLQLNVVVRWQNCIVDGNPSVFSWC